MNIDHLRLFVRVANTQNISQAGSELNLSPAVASAHINKLEASLGTRLIHRTTRQVSLTEDGQTFLPHAEDVLAKVDAAQAAVGNGCHSPSGTLRVTAPASFGRMHLIPTMGDFMDKYPDINLDYHLSDAIVDMVEGGFDIAIRNANLKSSSLIARKLATDQRILCASPSYIAKFGAPQTPQDISAHQCLILSGLDHWQFETPQGIVTLKARGRFKTDNGDAVREACALGLGITVNSTWSVYEHLKRGELVQILPTFPIVSETAIWAIYPSSRQLAPKVRAFIDYLGDIFGDTPYWDQLRTCSGTDASKP